MVAGASEQHWTKAEGTQGIPDGGQHELVAAGVPPRRVDDDHDSRPRPWHLGGAPALRESRRSSRQLKKSPIPTMLMHKLNFNRGIHSRVTTPKLCGFRQPGG